MVTGIDQMLEWLVSVDTHVRATDFVEPHVSTREAIERGARFKRDQNNEVIKYLDILAFEINNGQISTASDVLKEIDRLKSILK